MIFLPKKNQSSNCNSSLDRVFLLKKKKGGYKLAPCGHGFDLKLVIDENGKIVEIETKD